jgi:hypothetical protein
MPRIIPNNQTWIGFVTTIANASLVPTTTELGTAINLTPAVISINATTTGNTVATPSFDTLFETSIQGTSTATFTADMYRDTTDTAWITLPRGTSGYIVISRFGGTGANLRPAIGDKCEVWPIIVTSRAAQNLTNNTAQTFTITCAVPVQPNEAAVLTA